MTHEERYTVYFANNDSGQWESTGISSSVTADVLLGLPITQSDDVQTVYHLAGKEYYIVKGAEKLRLDKYLLRLRENGKQ